MKSQVMGLRVAAVLFTLSFFWYLSQLAMHVSVSIGSYMMPMWLSWIGLIVTGFLAIWMWMLGRLPAE